MQTSSDYNALKKVTYLTGNDDIAEQLAEINSKIPFDDSIVNFLTTAIRTAP